MIALVRNSIIEHGIFLNNVSGDVLSVWVIGCGDVLPCCHPVRLFLK
jgi:hypothetical protein